MIFLSALPWMPYSSDFIFGPTDEIELFENNIRTLDIFTQLSGSLSLPDLRGLEFNQTNDLIKIETNKDFIFDEELRSQIEVFCETAICSVEFQDATIFIRTNK